MYGTARQAHSSEVPLARHPLGDRDRWVHGAQQQQDGGADNASPVGDVDPVVTHSDAVGHPQRAVEQVHDACGAVQRGAAARAHHVPGGAEGRAVVEDGDDVGDEAPAAAVVRRLLAARLGEVMCCWAGGLLWQQQQQQLACMHACLQACLTHTCG
jgi:hypothetical protein